MYVGISGGADPQPQNIGAGLRDDFLRLDGVAERLRHLSAGLVPREAVGEHDVERRAAAGAAAFQQRRLEPAAVLGGALQKHHGGVAAIEVSLYARDGGKMKRAL